MSSGRSELKSVFLKEELSKIYENWAAAKFDSLPHVVHLLTSKDREAEFQSLKEQSEIVEDVVDEVVHAYHGGFNKAIQNYSQILRLFSTSSECIHVLKADLAEAKRVLGARNKQIHQMWYRSVTLRHIIALLDQIESLSTVPARIERLIADGQFYAAVQLLVQSVLMLEREGLQEVGSLQDVRSGLSKLRGVLFFKIVEELHSHLFNVGKYSSVEIDIYDSPNEISGLAGISSSKDIVQPLSRRTRSSRMDKQFVSYALEDGLQRHGFKHDKQSNENAPTLSVMGGFDRSISFITANGRPDGGQVPIWLSDSTPDEFIEYIKKSDSPGNVKYMQTLVECLNMLDKIAAAGAILCQRLRPTIRETISMQIKNHVASLESSNQAAGHGTHGSSRNGFKNLKGSLECHNVIKEKPRNGEQLPEAVFMVSPISREMKPKGSSQKAVRNLLISVLDSVSQILKNHIFVGELLESKARHHNEIHASEKPNMDPSLNTDLEASQVTGGYSVNFSLVVFQSECQQLVCEILQATPDASSTDAVTQTAKVANRLPARDKKDRQEQGLSFAFRFTETTGSLSNQGGDTARDWNKKGVSIENNNYRTSAVLPEQGIYLAASIYRPVSQFTNTISSMVPDNHSQLGNDGLQAFVENFLKDRFLPALFVDYWKCFQQAVSNPAAFHPRTRIASAYNPSIEKGRPILQGLLAIDLMAQEVLDWALEIPKYAGEILEYVRTFLERAYERCRTSYMEAVLEKQSYLLIGRHDIEKLMRLDPASACLLSSASHLAKANDMPISGTVDSEMEMSDLLFSLHPIKRENLLQEDKVILLAALSDSLEYVADSIERLERTYLRTTKQKSNRASHHPGVPNHSSLPSSLASLVDEYRKLSVDCLKVLRVEMQLNTIFFMQEMISGECLDYEDAEEPEDFIISLISQIVHRDEAVAPYIARLKRNYVFGGVCSVTVSAFIKALTDIKSINLLGIQQICENSIALEQALVTVPSIDGEVVQQRLDHVRTYYQLLNLPFDALLAFIREHEYLFTAGEYLNLVKVHVTGREVPADAEQQISELLAC